MSCCRHPIAIAAAGLAAALLALASGTGPVAAQEGGAGRLATFSLSQSLEQTRNRRLVPGGDESALVSTTQLGFTLDSRTSIDRLTVSTGTVLRGSFGDIEEDFAFSDPTLSFGYNRAGAKSDFALSATTNSNDITYLRLFEVIVNEDGTIELPEDIGDLTGTGTRRQTRISAQAIWGKEARLSFGTSLTLRDLRYVDVSNSNLVDSQSLNARLTARYAITPILQASTSLSYGRTEQDGSEARESRGLGIGLTARSGTGQISVDFNATRPASNDRRYQLSGRWATELVSGTQLAAELGTVWTASGESAFTAELAYVQNRPAGQLVAQLDRGVTENSSGDELLNTAGRVSYAHTINRLSQIGMEFSYAATQNLGDDETTRQTELGARYSRQFAQDWTASIGASRAWRDQDGQSAASDSLSLQFGRSFTSPF